MTVPMTTFMANEVLTLFFQQTPSFLGLHFQDPTTTGLANTEISGASYIRRSITWTLPGNRSILTSTSITFNNLPACIIGFLAVWNAQTGGVCWYSLPLPQEVVVVAGGTFTVPANDLAIMLN